MAATRRGAIGSSIGMWLLPALVAANVLVETPPGFQHPFDEQVKTALASLSRSEDAPIRQLHDAVMSSPATIVIRPITGDPATWHDPGDPNRRHTEPVDRRPKSTGRSKPTGAIVYIQTVDLDPRNAAWKQGDLVHELVHAVDLAYGRYHADDTVRERRAVFLQNVWRARFRSALRSTYHGRFATTDYQDAKRRGIVNEHGQYIFTRADFPSPR
jgi:hypothetical protein